MSTRARPPAPQAVPVSCRIACAPRKVHASPLRAVPLLFAIAALGCAEDAYAESYLDALGGSGGGQFKAICPDGSNLIGFVLRAADDVDAIQPFCGKAYPLGQVPSPGDGLPSGADAIATDAGAPWHGGWGGKVELLTCPATAPVVIGMDVAAEGVDTVVVNNIHLFCGQVAVPQAPPTYPSAIFDAPGYVPSKGEFGIGASGDAASVRTGSERCPANEVAIGMHGRSGRWLDAMGLVCGAPRLTGNPDARAYVSAIGKVHTGKPTPPGPAMTLCERARDARARNSPAAPNLESQCKKTGELPAAVRVPLQTRHVEESASHQDMHRILPEIAPTPAVDRQATP